MIQACDEDGSCLLQCSSRMFTVRTTIKVNIKETRPVGRPLSKLEISNEEGHGKKRKKRNRVWEDELWQDIELNGEGSVPKWPIAGG